MHFISLLMLSQCATTPRARRHLWHKGSPKKLAKGVLKESEGAVVFEGDESRQLHTRVFVTSKGLPTYETKDIGVIWLEKQEYRFDYRYILTGNDQSTICV